MSILQRAEDRSLSCDVESSSTNSKKSRDHRDYFETGASGSSTSSAAAKPAPAAKPSAINASAGTKEVWANIFQKRGRGDYADGNAKKKRKLSDSSSVAVVPPSSAGESTAKGDGDDEEKSTAMTKMEGELLLFCLTVAHTFDT